MAALTTRPLEDLFETSLSQAWDWSTWTIYIASAPNFTFPAWHTTYIAVNSWKSNYQVAEINAYDGSALTMTVSDITLEKWAWVNSTAQSHAVWSKVIISNSYQFWKDLDIAIDAKIDTADWALTAYANAAARDAVITSPANWMQAYLTDTWKFTDYTWGSWVDRESWWTFPNASDTVAWKVELTTIAEVQAWTDTGWAWPLAVIPSNLAEAAQKNSWNYWTAAWADTKTMTLTPTLITTASTVYTAWAIYVVENTTVNTTAVTLNIDGLWAKAIVSLDWSALVAWDMANTTAYLLYYDWTQFILINIYTASTTRAWTVETATDAEVTTWTDETRYVNPKQLATSNPVMTSWSFVKDISDATTTQDIAHSLGVVPKLIMSFQTIDWWDFLWQWTWTSAWDNNQAIWRGNAAVTNTDGSNLVSWTVTTGNHQKWAVDDANTDATNFRLDWVKTWTPTWSLTVRWVAYA